MSHDTSDDRSADGYECPSCDDVFPSDLGMKIHHTRIHGKSLAKPRKRDRRDTPNEYKCTECGAVFDTHNELGGHMFHCKRNCEETEVDCPSCNRSFKSRLALGTHHGKTHGESLKEYELRTADTSGMIECPVCGRSFQNRLGLGTHYGKKHEDPEPLKQLMLTHLREFTKDFGRIPKSEDLSSPDTDIWTQKSYHDHFGTIQEALKQAGLIERGRYRNIPAVDMCTELRRVHEAVGDAPYTSDMDAVGEYSYNSYIAEFGSWPKACEAAGVPVPNQQGSNNPMWRGGKSISDAVRKCIGDESWYATVSEIREMDGWTCRKCGRETDDRKLDGHHIVPIISGGCNADPLLMTLCVKCHRTIESYTRTILNPILVDWSLEDLPEGRLLGAEYMRNVVGRPIGQSELANFTTSD